MQRTKRLLLSVHICNTGTVGSSLFGIQIIAESLFYPFECSRISGVRLRESFALKKSALNQQPIVITLQIELKILRYFLC